MKRLLIVPILSAMLFGCLPFTNMPGTVKSSLDDPTFQAKNLPKRELNVLLLVKQDGDTEKKASKAIKEAMDDFDKQTGIRLGELKIIPLGRRASSTTGTLQLMDKELRRYRFDMAILYTQGLYVDDLMIPAGMIWFGKIDDTYRKYIITRSLSKWVLTHEIAHAFIFNHGHGTCLMMSGLFIAPFCHYLGKEDWQEVQRNKWRDFSEKPELRAEDRQDVIED